MCCTCKKRELPHIHIHFYKYLTNNEWILCPFIIRFIIELINSNVIIYLKFVLISPFWTIFTKNISSKDSDILVLSHQPCPVRARWLVEVKRDSQSEDAIQKCFGTFQFRERRSFIIFVCSFRSVDVYDCTPAAWLFVLITNRSLLWLQYNCVLNLQSCTMVAVAWPLARLTHTPQVPGSCLGGNVGFSTFLNMHVYIMFKNNLELCFKHIIQFF